MFSTNDRCIVLPSSRPDSYLGEDDMSNNAKDLVKDDKLLELLHLAMDQGWEIKPTNNGKLMWYPKDKDCAPVPSPMRLVGRSLANIRTALERAGLDTSSLKNDKARPVRPPIVAVQAGDPRPPHTTDLTEQEQVHKRLQDITAEVTLEALMDALPEMSQAEQDLEVVNSAIDVFIVQSARAAINLMSDVRSTMVCSHDIDDQLKTKLEEAERLYLETCQELEQLRKHADKLEVANSNLGTKVRELTEEKTVCQERALKAENRLRALRTALTED